MKTTGKSVATVLGGLFVAAGIFFTIIVAFLAVTDWRLSFLFFFSSAVIATGLILFKFAGLTIKRGLLSTLDAMIWWL